MTSTAKTSSSALRRDRFRERAELLLRESARKISKLPASDMHNLAHELHVHQMELEMQNEELRRVQLELEASRDRFSALYDFSPVGYLKLNDDGVIGEANLTIAAQLGVDRRDLIGKKLAHFLAPGSQDVFHLHRQKLFHNGGSRQICELKILKPAGGSFTGRLESVLLQTGDSGVRDWLIALSDITGELQAEAERAHLAAIVASSNDAIISSSLDDIIISWNAGAEAMFGFSSGQMVGRPISVLTPARLRNEGNEVRRQIGQNGWFEPFESVRLTKGRRRINVWITASPIKNEQGKILGISRIIRNVTRQKHAEEALRQNERNLADFFDEAPLGLVWVRRDGLVLRMNRAQLELTGREAAEVVNRPISEFLNDADSCDDLLRRLAAKETVKNHRAQFRCKHGGMKHVLIDANGLWQNRRLVHSRWFVRDISRRLELEREILAISEREQRRIGQDLHDDLGQQLAGVEFTAQSLAGQLARLSKPAADQADEITRMVRRAMSHVRDLAKGLAPISLEAEGLSLALRDLAASVAKIFRIKCRFAGKGSMNIADQNVAIYLYRIAQEAVNNAVKHGQARRIDITLSVKEPDIILSVRDDGVGISKKSGRKPGMGMRVMQYRAGMLGGSLVAQSNPEGGTTILCRLKDYSKPIAHA